MRTASWCVVVALGTVATVAIACGDSSGPGAQAASVTGVAGDSQVAPTGAQLTFPLSLTVLGSNGQPVQGVSVTWTSNPSGRVTFAPATTPSDVNGHVTTDVTAGTTPATVLVQAHVPGVSQTVDFHLSIIDPCTFASIHTLGSSVTAALTTHDCKISQQSSTGRIFSWYYDFYSLTLPTQTGVTLNMTASFDTYLDILGDPTQSPYVGFNDDISSSNLNSRFEAILAPGEYVIGANSADTLITGSYTLASVSRSQTIDNCPELWVTTGVVINDNIATTDCPDASGIGLYGDTLRIYAVNGVPLRISQRSSVVNSYLRLFQPVFSPTAPPSVTLVASNDDSTAGNTNAYLTYTPSGTSGSAVYLEIFVGTTGTPQTGAYTLEIFSSTTLSALRKSNSPVSPWGVWLGNRPVPQLGLRRGL